MTFFRNAAPMRSRKAKFKFRVSVSFLSSDTSLRSFDLAITQNSRTNSFGIGNPSRVQNCKRPLLRGGCQITLMPTPLNREN